MVFTKIDTLPFYCLLSFKYNRVIKIITYSDFRVYWLLEHSLTVSVRSGGCILVLGTSVPFYVHAYTRVYFSHSVHVLISHACIMYIVCGSTRTYATTTFQRGHAIRHLQIHRCGAQRLPEHTGNDAIKILFFQSCENFMIYSVSQKNNSENFNFITFHMIISINLNTFYQI